LLDLVLVEEVEVVAETLVQRGWQVGQRMVLGLLLVDEFQKLKGDLPLHFHCSGLDILHLKSLFIESIGTKFSVMQFKI
jgi:hypothetical protein